MSIPLTVREWGLQPYEPIWKAMQTYTDTRGEHSEDQIWLLEHPPVFTQGQGGKPEHVLNPGSIPVIPVDRGGQVTYHGPGQLVAYLLVDLTRRGFSVRPFVNVIEGALIKTLAHWGIEAVARKDAPGVYVEGAKIASLGLRIRNGRSYHGLALNVHMDLEPFSRINPCGFSGMKMTQLSQWGGPEHLAEVTPLLVECLTQALCETSISGSST